MSPKNSSNAQVSLHHRFTHSALFRAIAWISIISLNMQPLAASAQSVISYDPNAGRNQKPTIMSTGNGIPQVNITTPNDKGLSHNRYDRFDVDQNGAILNNNRTNHGVQTQIGGTVGTNHNLVRGAAKVILNEVGSQRGSSLNGMIEVAGQTADVIFASPNGISCAGCGFLNTNRVVLTTGNPLINDGLVTGFNVTGGQILIGEGGLNNSNVNYTDILTRALIVNAGIWAQDLKVVAGAHVLDGNGDLVSTLSAKGQQPEVAIDVAALGGMYAGKIHLIGNEAGVGVRNLGKIYAQAGNIVVTSDGRLENKGELNTASDLVLNAQKDIVNDGLLIADGRTAFSTAQDFTNNDTIYAKGGDVTLEVGGQLTNSARVYSEESVLANVQGGVNNTGDIFATNAGYITTPGGIINHGNLVAENLELVLSTSGGFTNTGVVGAGTDLEVESQSGISNDGKIYAVGSATLTSKGDWNNSGFIITNNGAIKLTSPGALTNSGRVYAGEDLLLDHQAGITNSGILYGYNDSHLTTLGEFTNTGKIYAETGTLKALVGTLFANEGVLSAGADLHLDAKTGIDNQGVFYAEQNATLVSEGDLFNSGEIAVRTGDLVANLGGRFVNDNTVTVGSKLTVSSAEITNNQTLYAGGNAVLTTSGSFTNNAGSSFTGGGDVRLEAQSGIDNQGSFYTAGKATLTTLAALTNSGLMAAGEDLTISAATVNNTDYLIAGLLPEGGIGQTGELTLTANTITSNGQHVAAGTLSLTADALNLAGSQSQANVAALLAKAGDIDLSEAELVASETLDLNAQGNVKLDRAQVQGGTVTISAKNLSNQEGKLAHTSANDLTLNIGETLNNKQGWIGSNSHNVTVKAITLNNEDGEWIHAGDGTFDLNIQTLSGANGTLVSNGLLQLNADHIDWQNAATIAASYDIITSTLDNRNAELIQSSLEGVGKLHTRTDLNNTGGKIVGMGDLELQLDHDYTNNSIIQSNGSLQIIGQNFINQTQLHAGRILRLEVKDLANTVTGEIIGGNTLINTSPNL